MAGAPLGNQNAAGSRYDLNQMAIDLDNWSKRPDAFALCEFCVEQDIYAQRIYDWRDESILFAEVLKKVKMRLAARLRKSLHDKDNPYNYGLFMREIASHDKFLHDFEREEKAYDASLKKNQEEEKELTINVKHFT